MFKKVQVVERSNHEYRKNDINEEVELADVNADGLKSVNVTIKVFQKESDCPNIRKRKKEKKVEITS